MDKYSPIGIFDSGAGGVSVLLSAVSALSNEQFIYFGDTANAPYGTKTKEQVCALAQDVADKLIKMDVKAIIIACNTATAAAAETLRASHCLPIIGMEPALKPASLLRRSGLVLVLATPGTLKSEKYKLLYSRYGKHAESLPCPGLMEFVERGEMDTSALHAYLTDLFAPFAAAKVDAVVLGCTHYVFIKNAISKHFSSQTAVIDGNEGTVRQLKRLLESRGMLSDSTEKGKVTLLSSGGEEALRTLQNLFYGKS